MKDKIKNIAVFTSGGDSPGMNAAVRAVVRAAQYHGVQCYGIRRGFDGMIHDDIIEMNARSVRNIVNKGGTILKTARSKEFRTIEGRTTAYNNLKKRNIQAIVAIGGDGTFTGVQIFSQEFSIPVIGLPGTIDNDIFGTDFTIGYDTALNTVVEAIDKIRDTASSHSRLFFIEVMGRDAGFLALNSGIGAGAEEILIPEQDRGVDQLLASLEHSRNSGKTSSIVVVAEGNNEGGGVYELLKEVDGRLDDYDIKVTVLGHIQRGGAPTCTDRVLAARMGVAAVENILSGISGVMVGVRNNQIQLTSLDKAIKQHNAIDKELLKVAQIVSI